MNWLKRSDRISLWGSIALVLWLLFVGLLLIQDAKAQALAGKYDFVGMYYENQLEPWVLLPDRTCFIRELAPVRPAQVALFENRNDNDERTYPWPSHDVYGLGFEFVPYDVMLKAAVPDWSLDLTALTDPQHSIHESCIDTESRNGLVSAYRFILPHPDWLCEINPASYVEVEMENSALNPNVWSASLKSVCMVAFATPRLSPETVYTLLINLPPFAGVCQVDATELVKLELNEVPEDCLGLWEDLRKDPKAAKRTSKVQAKLQKKTDRQGWRVNRNAQKAAKKAGRGK